MNRVIADVIHAVAAASMLAVMLFVHTDAAPLNPVVTTASAAVIAPVQTMVKEKIPQNITDRYTVSDNTAIPAGTTVSVRNGGSLYIKSGAELSVGGTLKIYSGGKVFVQGSVCSAEGSVIAASGKLKILRDGKVSLGGSLNVNNGGSVIGLGTLHVLNNFSDINCRGTVTTRIQAPEPVTQNGITTVGGILLVNRKYGLPEDYGSGLNQSAYNAYLKMKNASGYDMSIISGYRSYQKQEETYQYWVSVDGEETASRYSAKPGHSEHQTGLAIDITSLQQKYSETDEGKWLAEHCWEYGFILRYPPDSEKITGYIYEPWHVRYLGKSTAKLVHDSGLTLEEFLGVV